MINDTIDILDPFIINLGIEFHVKPKSGVDKFKLLNESVAALSGHFETMFYIGEALYITDIFSVLKDVDGILDVTKVKIVNKTGGRYAETVFDINSNMSPDGSYLIAPKNCIFEIKFPSVDIKGKIR